MSNARYDVVVVGAGPAGSIAAFTLATAGARVALVDKARVGRDKACGDLIGPRGVRILDDLGLGFPGAPQAGDMVVVGPSGRRVLLPAKPGRTYPGHAIVVPRARFDARLHAAALDGGAVDISGRVVSLDDHGVELEGGGTVAADFIVGADGATSTTARLAGLVDPAKVLWGFAVRGYVSADIALPVISLWNDKTRRGFPGYGWLFPGPDGANLGLGIGLGHSREDGQRAVQQLAQFRDHLVRIGVLSSTIDLPMRTLGGWLKMGMSGTRPAARHVLLVGDAAGLVNPLQGEGIAQALASGEAAARAVLMRPAAAAAAYTEWIDQTYGDWTSVTTPIHAALVHRPLVIAALASTLTAPIVGSSIAPVWALYWNNLVDGAAPAPAATVARVLHRAGRIATTATRRGVRRFALSRRER